MRGSCFLPSGERPYGQPLWIIEGRVLPPDAPSDTRRSAHRIGSPRQGLLVDLSGPSRPGASGKADDRHGVSMRRYSGGFILRSSASNRGSDSSGCSNMSTV